MSNNQAPPQDSFAAYSFGELEAPNEHQSFEDTIAEFLQSGSSDLSNTQGLQVMQSE